MNLYLPCVGTTDRLFIIYRINSYTVSVSKVGDSWPKSMSEDDFRGIAISYVISKLFEHCVADRFMSYFVTSDNQYGFKAGLGCTHAINTVCQIVNRFVSGGSTVNLCSIDLSKAFDRTNHHALFIKLMKRRVPNCLLTVLENWYQNCWTCVKWNGVFSFFFKIEFGVRQGSVLSPLLFAVYLDDIHKYFPAGTDYFIVLYADDILLLSPSVNELQRLLAVCETELAWLDMTINERKSACLR